MKRKYIIISSILLFLIVLVIVLTKKKVVELNNLVFEYNQNVKYSEIIKDYNGKEKLDTLKIGKNLKELETDKNIYKINYEVVDRTAPLVLIRSTYTYNKGTNIDLVNKILCADNYDKRPNCYIEGNYDFNKTGTYDLTYVATDSFDNTTKKKFKLKIEDKKTKSSEGSSQVRKTKDIKDVIAKYKNDNTMIGIDVSVWQDEIDFKKVKDSGVEFVMIRIGFGHNNENLIVLDKRFKENIKKAKEANLKVGVYFYSYAKSTDDAKKQALWIIKELNQIKLDLPIAFDWENWSKFNSYNISLTDINLIATSFMNTIRNNGYDTMLYSSYNYLEKIWNLDEYKTWLAHYSATTDYKGNYMIWQFADNGKVPGINANVDLNILYKNRD